MAVEKETEFERVRTLTEEFKKIAGSSVQAKKILVIPQDESYEEFLLKLPENFLRKGIPLGYEQEEITPYWV